MVFHILGTDREYSPGGMFWACATQIEGVGWNAGRFAHTTLSPWRLGWEAAKHTEIQNEIQKYIKIKLKTTFKHSNIHTNTHKYI